MPRLISQEIQMDSEIGSPFPEIEILKEKLVSCAHRKWSMLLKQSIQNLQSCPNSLWYFPFWSLFSSCSLWQFSRDKFVISCHRLVPSEPTVFITFECWISPIALFWWCLCFGDSGEISLPSLECACFVQSNYTLYLCKSHPEEWHPFISKQLFVIWY